jgi:serpin B
MTLGTAEISRQIAALGTTAAFDRTQADFSGINGRTLPDLEALFVSNLFHQAFVEVNEEGTEAAAATAAMLSPTAALGRIIPPPVPVFRADHPFVFAIRERSSGVILFLGRLVDPSA